MFEDGVGLVRSLKQLNYSPKMLFQTSAPSNAGQYSSAIGEANTEGVFYTVSWNQDATTPRNAEFVAAYQARTRAPTRPRTPPTPSPRRRCCRRRSTKVGSIDQAKLADWLHANEVQTSSAR